MSRPFVPSPQALTRRPSLWASVLLVWAVSSPVSAQFLPPSMPNMPVVSPRGQQMKGEARAIPAAPAERHRLFIKY